MQRGGEGLEGLLTASALIQRRPADPGMPRPPARRARHAWRAGLADLVELAGGYVEDEAADGILVRNERAGLDAGDGLADILLNVAEGLRGPGRLDPGLVLDRALERVIGEREHAAVGVVDQDDLGGTQ